MFAAYPGLTRTHGMPATLGIIVLAASPMPTLAQQADQPLEEITVTAQKRSESIQDVPIAITAFTSEAIERMGVRNAQDLVAQVPNMTVFNVLGTAQQPSLGIRGVTLSHTNDSFESPVALYIDEVYQGSLIGQTSQLFDIERVEVLKGPQGTLYGRNSTGGLIHAITRKPTHELSGNLSVEYGDHDLTVISAGIGGPLAERVRGRVAFQRRTADGWTRGFLDNVRYDDEDTVAARGILDIDLASNGTLEIAAQYSKVNVLGSGFALRGYLDPATGELCSIPQIETGACVSPSLGGRSANDFGGLRPGIAPGSGLVAARGYPPQQRVELQGTSARLEWDYGSWQLTALGAYNEVEKFYEEDLDADDFIFDDALTLDAREAEAELRAVGTTDALTWVVGAFYFDDHKDTGSFLIPAEIYNTRGIVDTTSWALFSQFDFAIAENWTLTAGFRYTDEDKLLDFVRRGFIEDGGTRQFHTRDITGRLALSWTPSSNLRFYASAASGFKTGGFNTQFIFGELDEIDPVRNEELLAYEVGMKSEWLQQRVRFNAAAFYYDYTDIQLTVVMAVPGAPIASSFLRNAGDSKIRGLDLELTLAPFENTVATIGAGLLRARLDSTQSAGWPTAPVPLDGKRLIGAPEKTFNVMLTRNIPLASHGSLYLQSTYSWRDRTYFSAENVATESQEAYGVLDAAVGWRSAGERWDVQVYLTNALDEKYSLGSVDLDETYGVLTWGRPRWWGLRVNYAL